MFIQQRNLHRNKLLEGNAGISIVPIVDDDARFAIDCTYRTDDEERLCTVLDTIREARDIVERHRNKG